MLCNTTETVCVHLVWHICWSLESDEIILVDVMTETAIFLINLSNWISV